MATLTQQAIVLFVDVLGFADLVMDLDDRIPLIDSAYYSALTKDGLRNQFAEWSEDPLTQTFVGFHHLLDLNIESVMRADAVQSVVFSDSAYVAFTDSGTATHFAATLMRDMLDFGIPGRMGVSIGSFRGIRLMTDVAEGLRRHSSQFLGTGVVRSYKAESCGLKGMRIFIHPESGLRPRVPEEFVSVAGSALLDKRRTDVAWELNYLFLAPRHTSLSDTPSPRDRHRQLNERIANMRVGVREKHLIQYDETVRALDRMLALYE